jgi:hypothetical protein
MYTPIVVLETITFPEEQDIGPFASWDEAYDWCEQAMDHPNFGNCFVSDVDESAGDVTLVDPKIALGG